MTSKPTHPSDPLDIAEDDNNDTIVTDTSASLSLLRDVIAPLDSYTEDGVYWADLPLIEQVSIFLQC